MATFYLKEEDTSPTLEATLREPNGDVVTLTDANVHIRVMEPRGGETIIHDDVIIRDKNEGTVTYTFSESQTAEEGRYRLDFHVHSSTDGDETYPNKGYHTLMISRGMETYDEV